MHTKCSIFALAAILIAFCSTAYAWDEDGEARDYSYQDSDSSAVAPRQTHDDFPQYAYYTTNGYYYSDDDQAYYNQSNYNQSYNNGSYQQPRRAAKKQRAAYSNYTPSMPQEIASREKVIIIDPRAHGWGAYSDGRLIRSGLATAGAKWCPDIGRPCRTKTGVFSIKSLGSSGCKSTRYPVGEGGAPMPYCMFFNGNQGLHGSYQVVAGNVSHGCVRVRVDDARWIRFNFAGIGTKVIVKSY